MGNIGILYYNCDLSVNYLYVYYCEIKAIFKKILIHVDQGHS